MSTTSPTPDGDPELVAALPAFQVPESGPGPVLPPPSADPTPPQGSTPRQHRPSLPPGPSPTTGSTSSSTAFSEGDVQDALGDLAGGVFFCLGAAANHLQNRKRAVPTDRWKPTEDEIAAFGEAAEKVAMRRVPDELTQGDGADALVIGSVLLGYAIRNLLGIDVAAGTPTAQVVQVQQQAPRRAAPAAAAEPEAARPTASVTVAQPTPGAEATAKAEPMPPAVIDPNI